MKSLATLIVATVVAVLLGAVGAFAVTSSIDDSPRNSDTVAAEQVDEGTLEAEVYGTN